MHHFHTKYLNIRLISNIIVKQERQIVYHFEDHAFIDIPEYENIFEAEVKWNNFCDVNRARWQLYT